MQLTGEAREIAGFLFPLSFLAGFCFGGCGAHPAGMVPIGRRAVAPRLGTQRAGLGRAALSGGAASVTAHQPQAYSATAPRPRTTGPS
jgi:hypothetical protein